MPQPELPAAVQDTPLALITKPRSQSSTPSIKPLMAAISPPYPIPINLKTGTEGMSENFGFPLKSSHSSVDAHALRKTPQSLCTRKGLVDYVRSCESDIHSSRESEDSSGDNHNDENNDYLENEDSGSSLSG